MTNSAIAQTIEAAFGTQVSIGSRERIGGGCIHHAERIETNLGTFFLKHNTHDHYENFQAEADGLQTLANTHTLCVPNNIAVATVNSTACLILEWIETGSERQDFWEQFGEALAELHQHSQDTFGYKRDNFIGALPQSNKSHTDWCEFFREERLLPMLRRALVQGRLSSEEVKRVERVFPKLELFIPAEPPALLHGDLWSGNFLVNQQGLPVVIDPAVYFGHREAELAFMQLFGGFDRRLFDAYNAVFPLESNWQERIGLFNLYPLLVHVNLFGRSYWRQIEVILKNLGV